MYRKVFHGSRKRAQEGSSGSLPCTKIHAGARLNLHLRRGTQEPLWYALWATQLALYNPRGKRNRLFVLPTLSIPTHHNTASSSNNVGGSNSAGNCPLPRRFFKSSNFLSAPLRKGEEEAAANALIAIHHRHIHRHGRTPPCTISRTQISSCQKGKG